MRERANRAADERGFTLVEILASLVVLAIAGLTMTAFFTHAMSNAKGNQNKTVMVNLARNTLFYMQKQSVFKEVHDLYQVGRTLPTDETREVIESEGCSANACTNYVKLVKQPQTLYAVLNPEINGILYRVKISYQDKLYDTLSKIKNAPPAGEESPQTTQMSDYLIPIKVEIAEAPMDKGGQPAKPSRKRDWMEVEGYITDETIR
ncbi:type IV pilus modification PilV family protein [Paenibacillus glycinis]|uniref:Prepilin-type N-terminal cleavage/methylation domain-containing protein n=1 Tax=Paenibacillus glycinis TaxID=2697035 RepID=A0ABW9XSA0_9BACL|nr:type II secretion system protein [Paenibacillus glycinis]NBD25353.1 prepilin-type N-terminal cleavage/methylation domain-containing protein [Paenibacillus glycinis]